MRFAASLPPFRAHPLSPVVADPRSSRFEKWYATNEMLTEQDPLPFSLSLPEVALDLTGLGGIIAAIYAGSYAYYLSARMEEAANKAAKQAARAKAAPAAKAKAKAKAAPAPAAASPAADASEEPAAAP